SSSQTWSQQTTTSSTVTLNSLIPNSVYNWKKQTICGSNSSEFSGTSNFTTQADQTCNTPTGLNASNITVNSVNLSWTSVSGASSYLIEYRLSGSGTWSQSGSATNSLSLVSLLPNSTYEWKVRTVCGGNSSPFSPVFIFN